MAYPWVLFDADGTLFDFDGAEMAALAAALTEVGAPFDPTIGTRYRAINVGVWAGLERGEVVPGELNRLRFGQLFAEIGVERVDPDEFGHRYLLHLADRAELIPGALGVLAAVASRSRVGLITNGLAAVQRPRLAKSGLDGRFEVVVVSEEIGVAKPDRAFFDVAFTQMGHPPPTDVLVVGDSLSSDIAGGAAYGTDTCWFNPKGVANGVGVTPTYEIAMLEELLDLV